MGVISEAQEWRLDLLEQNSSRRSVPLQDKRNVHNEKKCLKLVYFLKLYILMFHPGLQIVQVDKTFPLTLSRLNGWKTYNCMDK